MRVNSRRPVKKPTKNIRKYLLIGGLAFAVIVGSVVALELTNKIDLFNKQSVDGKTANDYTKGEQQQTSKQDKKSQASTASGSSQASTQTKSEQADTDQKLIEPSGNFVSSHKVSLAGGGQLTSTCNTTPGANCVISFVRSGTTKTLPVKQADPGGSVYWSWKIQDLGLSEGSWVTTATATLGNQKLEIKDALNLEVSK